MPINRRGRNWLAVAVAALGLGGVSLAAPTVSNANSTSYCGVPIPAHTACSYQPAITHLNVASYPGSPGINVCQRANIYPNGAQVSQRCKLQQVNSGTDLYSWCRARIPLTVYAGNSSDYRHTINGLFEYGNGFGC